MADDNGFSPLYGADQPDTSELGPSGAPPASAPETVSTAPDNPSVDAQPQPAQQGINPPTQPVPSQPQPQAQPASAPAAKQPSKWQAILTGALVGLSGVDSHAHSFGAGLVGGAQASLAHGQQEHQNQVQQQQLDIEHQRLAMEQQQSADSHATAQQQLAVSQANLAVLHTTYATMPKSLQDIMDRADMQAGATLRSEGTPVVSGPDGLSFGDAQQRIMAERNANPNSALQYVMHARPDGKMDVFQITDPNKTNDQPLDVTIGYNADTGKPISKHYDAHSISIAQYHNLETNAAINLVNQQNDLSEFRKKNAITVGGEIAVAKAKQQMDQSPVYALNQNGETVLTTKAGAIQGGMSAIRPVKETDITKDQHDIRVLSDIQIKANAVTQAAAAMDQKGWGQAAVAAKIMADNPNTPVNTLLKSTAMKNSTPQTVKYVIAVNSLRESSMGLQKVLTGTARTNETQLSALLNTLPGVEPDSGTVKQKLEAFTQNLDLLSKGLPKGTGVELSGFGGQQQRPQPQQLYKVGDPIYQGGHAYTVTAVDANGNVTGAK